MSSPNKIIVQIKSGVKRMMISNKVILHILYRNYKIFIKDIFSYLIIQTLNVHTDREFDNHDEQHLKLCIGK